MKRKEIKKIIDEEFDGVKFTRHTIKDDRKYSCSIYTHDPLPVKDWTRLRKRFMPMGVFVCQHISLEMISVGEFAKKVRDEELLGDSS